MKEQLLTNYFKTPFKIQETLKQKNIINVNFRNGPFVEIIGPVQENYQIHFEDLSNSSSVYSTNIKNGMWTAYGVKYFVPWRITIKSESYSNTIDLNLKNQKVAIINESGSLGDTIAWMNSIKSFQEKHDCILDYYSSLSEIFDKNHYSKINFYNYNQADASKYLFVYKLGCFKPYGANEFCGKDWRSIRLNNVADQILGLSYGSNPPELVKIEPKTDNSFTLYFSHNEIN